MVLKNPVYHFKKIGLEAGPLSQWLFSALAKAELPMICVETRHNGDAVGEAAIGDDGLAVGAIGIHRVNAVPAQFENEQSAGAGGAR